MAITAPDVKSLLLKRAIEHGMAGIFKHHCPDWELVGCDLKQQEDFRMMEHEVIVRMRFSPDGLGPLGSLLPREPLLVLPSKPSPLELFDPRAADEDFGSF